MLLAALIPATGDLRGRFLLLLLLWNIRDAPRRCGLPMALALVTGSRRDISWFTTTESGFPTIGASQGRRGGSGCQE